MKHGPDWLWQAPVSAGWGGRLVQCILHSWPRATHHAQACCINTLSNTLAAFLNLCCFVQENHRRWRHAWRQRGAGELWRCAKLCDVLPVVSPTCPVFVVGAQAMAPLAGLAQRRRARDVGLACWEGAAKWAPPATRTGSIQTIQETDRAMIVPVHFSSLVAFPAVVLCIKKWIYIYIYISSKWMLPWCRHFDHLMRFCFVFFFQTVVCKSSRRFRSAFE